MIFGSTLVFNYGQGDTFSGTTLTLYADQMPAYPFELSSINDRVSYRTKSGRKFSYENYNVDSFTFTWNLIDSQTRDALKQMHDALPGITISSGGTSYGLFRLADKAWEDSMSAFGLYDLSMTFEQENTL